MSFTMGKEPTAEFADPRTLTVDYAAQESAPAPLPTALKKQEVAVINRFEMPCIIEKAWEYCKALSHSFMLPANLRTTKDHDTTGDLYLILEMARSLDMSFIAAINGIYCLPDARPALYVSTKRALVLRAGGHFINEDFDENTQTAFCTAVRNGVHYTGKFSVQDAINRGKMIINPNGVAEGVFTRNGKPSPWRQDYRHMCAIRACGRACDLGFADVLLGLSSAEDVRDFEVQVPALPKSTKMELPPAMQNQDLQAALIPNNN